MCCRTATLAALLLPALITNANAATPVVCPPQWGPAKVLVQQDAVAAPAGWTGTGVMANSGLITQKLTLVVWNRAVTGNGNLQCQYGGLTNPQQPSSRYGTFLFSRAIPATCQPGPAWRATEAASPTASRRPSRTAPALAGTESNMACTVPAIRSCPAGPLPR